MKHDRPPHGRQTWIDALRLFAGLSMVGLHATADANGQPFPAFPEADRIAPMLLRAVLYTARTELFLMISVFLLILSLDRTPRSYWAVLSEQSRRLLLPFAAWTLFHAAYGLNKAHVFGYIDSEIARLTDPAAWAGFLLLGSVKYHMHFIPTLFGLILLFPLYRVAHRIPAFGLSILAFLLIKRELDAFVFQQFWNTDALPYLVRMVKVLTYAGYGMAAASILGLWQNTSVSDRRGWAGILALIGMLLFALKLVATQKTIESGTWVFTYTAGYWADFLMPVVLMACCMCFAHRTWPQAISRYARYSFGIYLCHPIFLDLAEIALAGADFSPIQQVAAKIAWTVPATFLFVLGLSRLPLLAWTIGLGPLPRIPRSRPRLGLS